MDLGRSDPGCVTLLSSARTLIPSSVLALDPLMDRAEALSWESRVSP